MKLLFILLLTMTSQISSAQTYSFDCRGFYGITYKNGNKSRGNYTYASRKSADYFMKIYSNSVLKEAIVADLKNKTYHFYTVLEDKESTDKAYTFVYKGSVPIRPFPHHLANPKIGLIKKSDTINNTNYALQFYRSKKSSKVKSEAIMRVEPYSVSMFDLFRYSCLHTLEFSQQITFPIEGLVTYFKTDSASFELTDFEEFDQPFVLTLPTQLKTLSYE